MPEVSGGEAGGALDRDSNFDAGGNRATLPSVWQSGSQPWTSQSSAASSSTTLYTQLPVKVLPTDQDQIESNRLISLSPNVAPQRPTLLKAYSNDLAGIDFHAVALDNGTAQRAAATEAPVSAKTDLYPDISGMFMQLRQEDKRKQELSSLGYNSKVGHSTTASQSGSFSNQSGRVPGSISGAPGSISGASGSYSISGASGSVSGGAPAPIGWNPAIYQPLTQKAPYVSGMPQGLMTVHNPMFGMYPVVGSTVVTPPASGLPLPPGGAGNPFTAGQSRSRPDSFPAGPTAAYDHPHFTTTSTGNSQLPYSIPRPSSCGDLQEMEDKTDMTLPAWGAEIPFSLTVEEPIQVCIVRVLTLTSHLRFQCKYCHLF
jgi:hypothetical protein